MSPFITLNFWNMTLFYTKLNVFATFNWRATQSMWRSDVHLMLWNIVSQPPLITTPNWCGEKCVAKSSRNWRHQVRLVNIYNVSCTARGRTPPKGLVVAKKRTIPRTRAIWGGMWPYAIWKQSWNHWGNYCWIFKLKTILKVFKNHPKKTICQ